MIEYEITEDIAVLGEANGRLLEVNMVSWQGRPAKVDIRRWSEDHQYMGKGIAMTEDEARNLYKALKERYGNEG